MKILTRKIIFIPLIALAFVFITIVAIDMFVLPWYVDAPEFKLPNLVGKDKVEAINILKELKLNPIEEGPKFDENIPKDRIIYHRPYPGALVKEGRRVYLYISGGDPLLVSPSLRSKTFRDAKITLERKGLILGEVTEKISDFERNLVIEQDPESGINIERGTIINLTVSIGPSRGKIRVPSILGKSLTQAKRILRNNSLQLGRINYQISKSSLPNVIFEQTPSEGRVINISDSVDVWVFKDR